MNWASFLNLKNKTLQELWRFFKNILRTKTSGSQENKREKELHNISLYPGTRVGARSPTKIIAMPALQSNFTWKQFKLYILLTDHF
jgi:hypothetical protein